MDNRFSLPLIQAIHPANHEQMLHFQYWIPKGSDQSLRNLPAASVLLDLDQFADTLQKRGIQAAIFDMDGTLVDSVPFWQNLALEVLGLYGITDIPASIQEQLPSRTSKEIVDLFLETFKIDVSPQVLGSQFSAQMALHYQKDIPLKPYAKKLVLALKQKGICCGVASATDERLARICLERLGIAHCFSCILSCAQLSTSKKKPDIYLEACNRLQSVPAKTAVFEDALYALITARNADFCTVALNDPGNLKDRDALRHTAAWIADLDAGNAQSIPFSFHYLKQS